MFKFLEKNKIILIYLPLCIYWTTLFVLTSLPAVEVPSIDISDKIEHFFAFFGLTILTTFTFAFQNKIIFAKQHHLIVTFLLLSFYGVLDEVHQLFIPGRSCEFLDWFADFTGVLAGILIFLMLKRINSYFLASSTTYLD